MSRAPRYNKTQAFRIISLPAGMWQLQEHMGGKGTKTFDPWKKAGNPVELDQAVIMLQQTENV